MNNEKKDALLNIRNTAMKLFEAIDNFIVSDESIKDIHDEIKVIGDDLSMVPLSRTSRYEKLIQLLKEKYPTEYLIARLIRECPTISLEKICTITFGQLHINNQIIRFIPRGCCEEIYKEYPITADLAAELFSYISRYHKKLALDTPYIFMTTNKNHYNSASFYYVLQLIENDLGYISDMHFLRKGGQ